MYFILLILKNKVTQRKFWRKYRAVFYFFTIIFIFYKNVLLRIFIVQIKEVFIKIFRFYRNNHKNLLKIAEKAIFFYKIVRFLRFTKKQKGSLIFTEKNRAVFYFSKKNVQIKKFLIKFLDFTKIILKIYFIILNILNLKIKEAHRAFLRKIARFIFHKFSDFTKINLNIYFILLKESGEGDFSTKNRMFL